MKPLAALLIALRAATLLFACAVEIGPYFIPPVHPENRTKFNRGRLGLLTPGLSGKDQLIAFRLLSGLKIDAAYDELGAPDDDARPPDENTWLSVRQALPDPPAPPFINSYRTSHASAPYVFYLNCLDAAFQTAANTLLERKRQYPSPGAIAAWVAAQDLVFADCSGDPPVYPAPLPASATPLMRQDRDYQIAAAHFYAEDFAEAELRFHRIGDDPDSPWRNIGAYMVGRTWLRELTLLHDPAAGPRARRQFESIAGNPSSGSLGDSARGLLKYLDFLENPGALMTSLSKELLLPQPPAEDLEKTLESSAYLIRSDSVKAVPDEAEAFDYVQTLRHGDAAHAIAQWTARKSLPWLTVSLMYATGKDPAATELIQEAERLIPSSPAFGTARYNAVRLRMERGETEQPRRQLDALLSKAKDQPDSLRNGWKAERMRLARTFDELLRYAPRKPVDIPEFLGNDPGAAAPLLDADSAAILNYRTPLSNLVLAARSASLPAATLSHVTLVAWTRGFMLNDSASVSALAPLVAKAHPSWGPGLLPAGGPDGEWRFRAALLISLHRQFNPIVQVNYSADLDSGSWWCAVPKPRELPTGIEVSWKLPVLFTPPEAVLSRQERNAAQTELEKLRGMGSAQSFLAPIFFEWAKTHPDDPLVPQALHRLVMITRYGCYTGDGTSGPVSKAAFNLLHKNYPKSEWTAKTPYWFNH